MVLESDRFGEFSVAIDGCWRFLQGFSEGKRNEERRPNVSSGENFQVLNPLHVLITRSESSDLIFYPL